MSKVKQEKSELNIVVVYDSAYGNTEMIAKAMVDAVYGPNMARLVLVGNVTDADLEGMDVLIVGSPTQGGMATKAVQEFIARLAPRTLKGVSVAAFDTRYAISEHGIGLKVLMKAIGFGAPRIATALRNKGGKLVVKPEGFLVENKEGPLLDGEIERAEQWAEVIIETVTTK